ncbi:MAG: helicase-related protein [Candidatus Tenebribacter davisii]|nr:helicase-related protein [Candidatus Tenebribacter davisii]
MSSNFMTNADVGKTLESRIKKLIKFSEEIKILVGFFYFSGWQELSDSLRKEPGIKLKVLVGLQIDSYLGKMLEVEDEQKGMSKDDIRERFYESLQKGLNDKELDNEEFYQDVDIFIDLLQTGRLELRKSRESNHAKLYIFKAKDEIKELQAARFITGSSNLTRSGFRHQNEFNVEISDFGTKEAEKYFDELWIKAVPIDDIDVIIKIIKEHTQAADITPFEAYTLMLKTYLETQQVKKMEPIIERLLVKHGYKRYSYQLDAVNQALSVLENYNGVIIGDVVGLGKSLIACMTAASLNTRGLIICPPALIGDSEGRSGWIRYKNEFELFNWEIYSSGKLEKAIGYLQKYGDSITTIVIDEAHRYRNQDTESYELLSEICKNRNVMLLTATPFNNSPSDIFSLLKLFIIPGKSGITLDDNLDIRFKFYSSMFKRLAYISKHYQSTDEIKRAIAEQYYTALFEESLINIEKVRTRTKFLANEIRKIISPVIIRRNRIDLQKDSVYKHEISQLSEIADPIEMFYELTEEQDAFYNKVISEYFGEQGKFTGAIYRPFRFEQKSKDGEAAWFETQQENLFEFMRRLIVKRFESSFGSFCKTIENFIRIHEMVLKFIEKSDGLYILDRKLMESIFEKSEDEIEKQLEKYAEELEKNSDLLPKRYRIYKVEEFHYRKEFLEGIVNDLNLFHSIKLEMENLNLTKEDPKQDKLIEKIYNILKSEEIPKRKVIVFSEYVDTVKHLRKKLEKEFKGRILTVPGKLSAEKAKAIVENFDASFEEKYQKDDFDVLLTSDKMSEGVNLNRAGVVINYDIPWNPTRVIQRVGRINRIGKKVFEKLFIINSFPTTKGAEIVRSRETAQEKMFMIHNTLGEDAKIFDIDEIPTAAELYRRINSNPEDKEDDNVTINVRNRYFEIKKKYPDVITKINNLPARVKSSKSYSKSQLIVMKRKRLSLFMHVMENSVIHNMFFEDIFKFVECEFSEPKLNISETFWGNYIILKDYKGNVDNLRRVTNEMSIEQKALNNLNTAIRRFRNEFEDIHKFLKVLKEDMLYWHTLPRFTIRRLSRINLCPGCSVEIIKEFQVTVRKIKARIGEDYLSKIKQKFGDMEDEIVIAIENVNSEIK